MRLAESIVLLVAALCSNQGVLVHGGSSSSSSTSPSRPPLVFANRKDIQLVWQRGGGGGGSGNATVLVNGLEDAAAMDFLAPRTSPPSPGYLFWSDVSLSVIRRAPMDGTRGEPGGGAEDVASTGLLAPDGLAVDWLGRKLYWTDSETDRIEVAELDGALRKVLIWQNLDQPRAIALDPANGYMYWTDWGEVPKIERVGMDGAVDTRAVLIDEDIYWPNGLTLDYMDGRLYWADAKLKSINSCELDGSDRQTIIKGTLPHPFAITLYGERIYWTDWKLRAINSCNKRTGKDNRTVLSHIYSPMDIHVFSSERQPTGTSPCDQNNGGCSDLCLMSPRPPHYSCACPTGVPMLSDGTNKTCAKGASEMVLLARRWDIRRISLDTPDHTDVVLPLHNLQHAIAIDYDPVDGHVYWTDDEVRLIRRAYLDGSGQESVVSTEVDHPDGLAVDWVARNLYWTDTGADRIEVARLNGTARRTLISTGLKEPRAIVLYPQKGYMYWTDWGESPKIERAALDGSDRLVLVNVSLGWPNGLALDMERGKLYWGDARTDVIEVADLDGSNRRTLVSDMVPHIFGLSLLGDYIYWTDWQKRSVERVNKYTGLERERISEELPDIMGLRAVNVNNKDGWNPCYGDAYGCSHLCLHRPSGPVCACPMGLELLADARTCIVPEAFLLFSRSKDIRRISLEINNNDVLIPISGVKAVSALDFDINDNRIYWTDTSLKMISRAFMNGSAHENVVLFGLDNPEGMAVDWVAHNLYWADSGTQRVEMSRLDGSSRRVLLWRDVSEPRSIALDPQRGNMYWSDWGKESLERASLDGTNRQVIIHSRARRNSLTIDHAASRLYWTNIDEQKIGSSDLDGSNIHYLEQQAPFDPFSLTQYSDFVYWTDWQTMSIDRANKTTGENRTRIQGQLEYIMDILVFHASRQQGWNRCGLDNGGCSHLCIAHGGMIEGPRAENVTLSPNAIDAHHCACPTHYTLMEDGKNCRAAESFLLLSQKTMVRRVVVGEEEEGEELEAPDVVLPVHSLRSVRALAYDPRDHYIYWVDGKTKTIRRALQDGRNMSVVVANPRSSIVQLPHDVAVDPFARRLYWSDARHDVINVTRLDGGELWPVGVVVSSTPRNEQQPRKIALAPQHGYMFWTNVARQPRIERSAMDGTRRLSLVTTELGSVEALTTDPATQTLYWADKEFERIEMVQYDGSNRRILIEAYFKQPVGLAVLGDFLYWADKDMKTVERVHKGKGDARRQILSRVASLSGVVAVTQLSERELQEQACSYSNGGCSHLCVVTETGRRCSCPHGLQLEAGGERSCLEPPTCDATQFTCNSGTCLPLHFQCDGSPDCDDRSDEENCEQCLDKCRRTGECITAAMRCNGVSECEDGTDERGCQPCEASMYACATGGTCILPSQLCNNHADCPGGDDERGCDNGTEGKLGTPHRASIRWELIIVVLVILGFVVALIIIVVLVKRKRQPLTGSQDVFLACKPLANGTSGGASSAYTATVPPTVPPTHTHIATTKTSLTGYMGPTGSSTSPGTYDRERLTGASSNSSGLLSQHYPYETLNPPPSPVTERGDNSSVFSASSSLPPSSYTSAATAAAGRKRGAMRGRYVHLPPLPTPCSTDVCEDSEMDDDATPLRARTRNRMHGAARNGGIDYDSADSFTGYSASHPPPCPTPRSQYFSDPSCPPSPLTERSFNPYPPPPSPVGTSDC